MERYNILRKQRAYSAREGLLAVIEQAIRASGSMDNGDLAYRWRHSRMLQSGSGSTHYGPKCYSRPGQERGGGRLRLTTGRRVRVLEVSCFY